LAVIHDVAAIDSETGGHESIFQRPRVHQNHVRVAGFPELKRLSGPDCDDVNMAAAFGFEGRQEHVEQT
jgi:hypothetical protein